MIDKDVLLATAIVALAVAILFFLVGIWYISVALGFWSIVLLFLYFRECEAEPVNMALSFLAWEEIDEIMDEIAEE